jgi:hypothetical protein
MRMGDKLNPLRFNDLLYPAQVGRVEPFNAGAERATMLLHFGAMAAPWTTSQTWLVCCFQKAAAV